MSYDSFSTSRASSQPDELYEFEYLGDSSFYRFTSSAFSISYDGNDYDPLPCKRSPLQRSKEVAKNTLSIEVPSSTAYFLNHIYTTFTYQTKVKLYSLENGTDAQLIWTGVLSSVTITTAEGKSSLSIECTPITTSIRKPILHRKYQVSCPHLLGGYYCTVNRDSYSDTGTLSSVSGVTLTSPTFGLQADGYYTGGEIKVGSELRSILKHEGDEILLLDSFLNVVAGNSFTVYAGCGHNLDDCENKFSNVLNFGGFPWIPQDDNITTGKPFTY